MRKEIYHQYAHSTKLLSLIDGMAQALTPSNDLKNFYDIVFNINSASSFGLDIWGDILNVKRSLPLILNRSNYVTRIPNNIRLEKDNRIVRLKSGSTVYVPNDAGVFDKLIVPYDLINDTVGDGEMLLCVYQEEREFHLFAGFQTGGSVSERPANPIWRALYYNTTTNKIEFYNGSYWVSECSVPFAVYTRDTMGAVSIDQVFEGFGYVGSNVFILPSVRGLIPDGKNSDGSFRNIVYSNSSVRVCSPAPSSYTGNYNLYLSENRDIFQANNYYDVNENIMTDDSYQGLFICGSGQISQGKIESFTLNLTSPGFERQYTMSDDEYRLILKLAASKNISDATCENIYQVLNNVFSELGDIYVSDLGEMHLRYAFDFLLSDIMYAILRQTKVVPRPAGVGVEIYEMPSREIIGFNGQELETLNNGTFFQGVRDEQFRVT